MRARDLLRSDLAAVVAAAAIACLAAGLLPSALVVLRALLALPLVLLVPGYALTAAIFGARRQPLAECAMFALALSLSATVISGLALDGLGVGLTARPWMGVLAAVTVVAAAIAALRGHVRVLNRGRVLVRPREAAALAAAVVLLGGAAALGFTPLHAPSDTGDGTGFVGIDRTSRADTAVTLTVINDELQTSSYSLSLTVAGRPRAHYGPIRLAPGESWTRRLAIRPGRPRVVAKLEHAGSSTVLDSVYMSCWCSPPARPHAAP